MYPPHVVLFLSSTDKYAGLDKIQYKMNDGQLLPYRSLIENFKANTKYTVSVALLRISWVTKVLKKSNFT